MSRSFAPSAAVVLALGLPSWGCSRAPEPPATTSSATAGAPATPRESAGLVDGALVDACAGFTVEKAADILGVPSTALTTDARWSKDLGGQMCRYWSPDSLIGPGIHFLLEAEKSATAAAASVASLRENAPAGDAAIRTTIGQEKTGPSLIELDDVGDEAIWDALTSGVTLRVGNVVASIQASGSRQLSSDKERADVELERRVAVEVAQGLRSQ